MPLKTGSNVITVTATDTAGNTATATLTVSFKAAGSGGSSGSSCGALGLEVPAILFVTRIRRASRGR